MKKQNYISLVLLLVFSFVLMHNFIPHHHHDDVSEINNHEHHHDHDHDLDHDKNEQDHPNKNEEPVGIFSHPAHFFASAEFVFHVNNNIQKTQSVNLFLLIPYEVIKPITFSIRRKPPNYNSVVPIQLFHSSHSLRGPPAFSV